MELSEGYKRTKVSVFPEDWFVTDFDTVGSVIDGDRGRHYPNGNDFSSAGYCLFLNAGNVTKEGFRFSDVSFITEEKDTLLNKGKLKRYDIVLTTRGTVGNLAYYDSSVPYEHMRINSGMVILRNESPTLDTGFLYAFLQSDLVQSQIERLAFGSAQPQLTVKGISKLQVVIPPLPEQRAMADALSDVDALIEKLDALIAKKRAIKTGAMQRLLTGEQRLPGFSGAWETKRLGDILECVRNGAVYQSVTSGGVPVTRIETIADGSIDLEKVGYARPTPELEDHLLQRGDILFSHINSIDHIGKVALYEGREPLYHGR